MIGYIYFLQEKDTNNIFYIGSSFYPDTRKYAHRAGSKKANSTLYSYMNSNVLDFSLNIIEEVEVESEKELLRLEIYWIHQFRAWGFDLKNSKFYNTSAIGNGNNHVVPLRLGELKPILQAEAFKLNISLTALILKILKDYITERGIMKKSKPTT